MGDRRLALRELVARRSRTIVIAIAVVTLIAIPVTSILANHTFSDVPSSAFYHNEVDSLVNAGITSGCGGGKYCPNNAVTRGQMAVFLDLLGNLSGQKPAVVDARTTQGFVLETFSEPFELSGGAPTECESTTTGSVPFGFYGVLHTIYGYTPSNGDTLDTALVNVTIKDGPDDPGTVGVDEDLTYEVCFATIDGSTLPAGTYDTYYTFGFYAGEGVYGSSAGTNSIAKAKAAAKKD